MRTRFGIRVRRPIRSIRFAGLMVCALLAAGCGVSPVPTSGPPTPSNGKGAVVGGLPPCAGIVMPGSPHYEAGTVIVLKGRMSVTSLGQGHGDSYVLPKIVAAQQTVTTNGSYRFELDPGEYVFDAHYSDGLSPVPPYSAFTVKAGAIERIDIPVACL
jgi:hypothetical protein